MYESFFGLRERPFPSSPIATSYFPAESIEHARKQLVRCVERGEGTGLVVGSAGTGKTMLLHVLSQHFRDKFHVAMLASTSLCTRRALLQSILFELKLPYRGLEEGELRLSLVDHLRPSRECPHGMVLLIDEAHSLPLRLLEEIRLLSNLAQDGSPRVRIVMAGTLSLEERLSSPKLASFSQRVAARCYLHAMNGAETGQYIKRHLERAGGKVNTLFTDDALRAVHAATDGISRLINQVCDHAFLLAAAGGKRVINAAAIQEAWSDLQQLPAPWTEPAAAQGAAIEFGALSDADDDAVLADPAQHVAIDLDDIDLRVASLHDAEFAGRDREIAAYAFASLPIEIVSTNAEQVFGTSFQEEEIVIDRYAALDAVVLRDRPQVHTAEGQAFTVEVLHPAALDRPTLKLVDVSDELADEELPPVREPQRKAPAAKAQPSKPAAAPLANQVAKAKKKQSGLMAEPAAIDVVPAPHHEPARTVTFSVEPAAVDEDYDPVFPDSSAPLPEAIPAPAVEKRTDSVHSMPLTAPVRPRRPEFRQLFANLRGK